jgi:hypothetical protein
MPATKTLHTTKSVLEYKNIETKLTQEIVTLLHTILNQNYFQFANNFYNPEKGVAMESPISSLITEIFLEYQEDVIVKHMLISNEIIHYNRYVVDVYIFLHHTKITEEEI